MNKDKLEIFMQVAESIAKLSPDEETKVGCLAVHPETYDCKHLSYNGFISGANDTELPKTRPEKYQYIVHAEANMVAKAASENGGLKGYWSVQTLSPCVNCCRLLYQAGVRTIIFKEKYKDFEKQLLQNDLEFDIIPLQGYHKLTLKPKKPKNEEQK